MGPTTVIELADALCVIVALTSSALLLRARRQLRETRRCCAVLDTVPLRCFRWNTARGKNREVARPAAYEEFLAGVGADDAVRLEAARLTLRSVGGSVLGARRDAQRRRLPSRGPEGRLR